MKTRTLTALPELNNQWVGIVTKARINIRPQSDNLLIGKVSQAEYAEIHQQLSQGWDSELDEKQLAYRNWPLSEKPFEIHLKNGAIRSMSVDRTMTNGKTLSSRSESNLQSSIFPIFFCRSNQSIESHR